MNNSDLADRVAEAGGVSKADARKIVDSVFAAIADAASTGTEVSISGFGKFKVKESAAREGRNPATGATIQIAASKKLGFTPAKAVKDRLIPCPPRRPATFGLALEAKGRGRRGPGRCAANACRLGLSIPRPYLQTNRSCCVVSRAGGGS
jgi:DNA-binding protein HU-beta